MLLRSPKNLHYPVTVTELLKQHNADVDKYAPLFSYFYKSTVTTGNDFGEWVEVEKTFPTVFESETDGKIVSWKIDAGAVISGPGIALVEIEEPCRHEVQYGGMCADCGKDMTMVSYNTSSRDSDRATINMAHGTTALFISQSEAARLEEEAKRRLLSKRKLSLVVDLDQTIIHATVDPTVAEWQKDENNPNHGAVKDVRSFQLVDDGPGGHGCWYYIKLRPGLMQFLRHISELYELHIYTMGTRAYATNIAKIIDPDQKIFGDRILSRDESGSMQVKNLQRLFPVDTKMVAIIDDRGDVWSWSDNLIKVNPYDFFVGIGDINSSFLPKRQEATAKEASQVRNKALAPGPAVKKQSGQDENGSVAQAPKSTNGALSRIGEQLVAMGGGGDPNVLQSQSTQQEAAIAAQVSDRPLLQKQKQLDEADEKASEESTNSDSDSEQPSQRHNLLHDDDNELDFLEQHLRSVHRAFYEEYDRKLHGSHGGRVAELRGERPARKLPVDDLRIVPDIKAIMPFIKAQVLRGVNIVFTGVVPLGVDVYSADISRWAKSFGANVSDHISGKTTHVIAARDRKTAKVRQAAKRPHIKIVTMSWLLSCFLQWEHVDEGPHIIHAEPDETNLHGSTKALSPFDEPEDGTKLSSSDDEAAVTDYEDGEAGLTIATDVNDDIPDSLLPTSPTDESRQLNAAEWEGIGEELKEFLGDSDTDSDSDASEASNSTRSGSVTPKNRKRKRETQSAESSETEESDSSAKSQLGSRLQKRKRRALERVSSLTNVASADMSSGLPSPDTTGPEGGQEEEDEEDGGEVKKAAAGNSGEADGDEDDDDMAAALEAEMEAALDDDEDD
ncbi:hypothetical protein BDY21DRAFT_285752 [Lineolata rhizophorae]|uniref:RNA polymerase II subunit A C-terminal domain phosphatase n=1 Tax=Lineolata rhizophorae TaxID=578093 RepID=A0A6A6P1A0_9PEZI|nr:hypothetical protein BDY21DRAFT_285752 [Lineolata rhizophorae]